MGDVVEVLLGLPPARAAVGPPALAARAGEYRLTLPLAAGAQTIWFAGDTLSVRRAEETREGALALRVAFDDYRDGFPHLIEVGAASGVLAPPSCGVPSGTPRRSSLRLPLSLPGSFASLTMTTRTDS